MRMKVETVESFVDFCLRPDNIQDVAYGTRAIKNEDGTAFICPQWIRKNHLAKMIRAFKQEFQNQINKMPSRTWMYKFMDWVATKDMVCLAGLDNTDVAGKKAMIETAVLVEKVMNGLGDSMPAEYRGKVGAQRYGVLQVCAMPAPGGQHAHQQPCIARCSGRNCFLIQIRNGYYANYWY